MSSELLRGVFRQVSVHFCCGCLPLHLSQCHREKLVPRLLKLFIFLVKVAGREKRDCRVLQVYSTLPGAVLASIRARKEKKKEEKQELGMM